MSETMREYERADAAAKRAAVAHVAECGDEVVVISGEGWVCRTCDDDYARMSAWGVEAGRSMTVIGPKVEVWSDGMKVPVTGELFEPTETDDVWWSLPTFLLVAERYESAVYVGVDDVLFPDVEEASECDHEMPAKDLIERLLEDGSDAVAAIECAADAGWLVGSEVALLETGDGRRFLVTVQEVTDR